MQWNFGDILDAIEPVLDPARPALIHGERVIAWGETAAMTNNLARALLARGAQPLDKVAFYMRNRPEYVLGLAACAKAQLTHVNVNYRYTPEEVWYIFDNADATVVLYTQEFRGAVEIIRDRLPHVTLWVEIGDGVAPAWAVGFDDLAQDGDGSALGIERSGDDEFFIYTGGTTGMPKGVVWTHHALREIGLHAARKLGPVPETMDALVEAIRATPGPMTLPAPPLMHGTGLLTALNAHLAGGCVITLEGATFDPREMAEAIDRHRPVALAIVGDSFARPLLEVLDAEPGRYDCTSVLAVTSSGVMWSVEVKRGLLRHMPNAMLSDAFSSSEAIGMGSSVMTVAGEVQTAKFALSDRCRVFDEDDRPVEPGSGKRGIVALGPPNPLGYYKDAEKTARTFREIDGVVYSIPGDWCTVEADGTLTLLGRGNACINTAGEKVFPEEVEEALKTHESVADALVVGLPDPKWGQAVTGVVSLREGHVLDEGALQAHVRRSLAGYKTPKRIVLAAGDLRTSNGKADYPAARGAAELALESSAQAAAIG